MPYIPGVRDSILPTCTMDALLMIRAKLHACQTLDQHDIQHIFWLRTHALHRKRRHLFLRLSRQLNSGMVFTSNDFGSYLRPHCHVGYQTLVLKKKSKPLDFQNEIA
ncbi:hypothetical protein, partial [Pseudomonas viridiflava]|uniref:hypothetical protein n=1 Tax=Pseudomonas viridiflava TaxID=33069 RepID=UPI0019D14946